MENAQFLQSLRERSLEEGKDYIRAHAIEIADLVAMGDMLADEALAYLYSPFASFKLAELLIFFGTHTQHLYSHALGLKARGDVLAQIGHYQAAMDCLDESGNEFLQIDDEANWGRSRISWIVSATSLGRIEEALQQAGQARAVFLRQNEPYWACIIDHNTAWIYRQVGRYHDAGALYKRILAIYPTLTDQSERFITRAIAIAKVNQAVNLSWLGMLEQSYRLQQEAQASFSTIQDMNMAANAEINLADLDYIRGYYGSALRRYYTAQDILLQQKNDNPRTMAELKRQIARTLVKLNRSNEACQMAAEAVAIFRELDASLYATNALREYATTLVATGRLQEALAVLNEAQTLFERDGFHHYILATRLQRAELLLAMSDAAQAYEEAQSIKLLFYEQGLAAQSVQASLVIAGSLLAQARQAEARREQEQYTMLLQKAVSSCEQAITQARQLSMLEEVYKGQYLLGQLLALQGNTAMAARYYTAAIAQVERILNDLVYDLSPSFLQTAWAVYAAMITACLQQGKAERAFNYLERARSMALRQYLNIAASPERRAEKGESDISSVSQNNSAMILRTQDELKSWQKNYRNFSVLLMQMDAKGAMDASESSLSSIVEREIIETELKRCEAKVNELFEHLYVQQFTAPSTKHAKNMQKSQVSNRGNPGYLNVAQFRQRLSPEQLVLAYFLDKERIVIFAVTAGQFVTYEHADGMKQLRRLLPFLHAHLQPGGWANPRQPGHSQQQAVREMLKKLYDLLIAPVAVLLPPPSGSVTIVPYGPLHTLPFHALYDGSHFLVEQYQVSYLPTASMLTRYDRSTLENGTAHEQQSPLIFGYSGNGHLQRALEEARTLAAMLDGRCFLEEEATNVRLTEQAAGSPIIHLATHGQSRLDAPNFSSVLLADGRFTAIDAFSLNLRACELVTLSGCETGLAMSGGGDEQPGLGRAFLAAGARSLVMSLWPVEDAATSELMQVFYRHLLRGESKVQALRSAQCAFINSSNSIHTHPYYWGAFRLVGDTGPLQYAKIHS
ncbi:MAG: CHAT domain-containing protein [Ktedonobacteraceae bacterium]